MVKLSEFDTSKVTLDSTDRLLITDMQTNPPSSKYHTFSNLKNSIIQDQTATIEGYVEDALDSKVDAQLAQANAEIVLDNVVAVAEAVGNKVFYNTYALANTAVGGLSNLQVVEVFADETKGGVRTLYRKEGGILVYKATAGVSVEDPFTPIKESPNIFSPTIIRDILENKIYLNMLNPTVDGVTNLSPKIQACLDEVAKESRRGRREVVITGKGNSNLIGLRSRLFMPTTLIPLIADVYGIRCEASYPTVWDNLVVDGLKYKDRITITNASGATYNTGDCIVIRSQKLIDTSPNIQGAKIGQQCKIWKKEVGASNTILHLDQCLNYTYLLSDTAQVGKILNPKEDIRISNFRMGEDGRDIRGGNAITLEFVDGARIEGSIIKNLRNPNNANLQSKNGITINGGRNIIIENTFVSRAGWYSVGIQGCAENIRVYDLESYYPRHHTSLNWDNFDHEPQDVYIKNARGYFAYFSGFDTHDVGINTHYEDVISVASQFDAGFQLRTSDVKFTRVKAYGNYTAGIICRTETGDVTKLGRYYIENSEFDDNLRGGVNMPASFDIHTSKIRRNGFGESYSGGITTRGGLIKDCVIEENHDNAIIYGRSLDWFGVSNERLVVDNITAPASANQFRLFSNSDVSRTTDTRFDLLELKNSYVPGYSDKAKFFTSGAVTTTSTTTGATPPSPPVTETTTVTSDAVETSTATDNISTTVTTVTTPTITTVTTTTVTTPKIQPNPGKVVHSNNRWGTDKTFGYAQLVGGKAYVSNNNVWDFLSNNYLEAESPRPRIQLTQEGVSNTFDGIPNKGFAGTSIGTGVANLPDEWVIGSSGLGVLTLSVVGFNANIAEPYVDVRINGTSSTTACSINFGSSSALTTIQATVGTVWNTSYSIDLIGGSMANVNSINHVLAEYNVSTDLTTQVDGFPFVITSTDTLFSKQWTVTNANTNRIRPGFRFLWSNNVALNFTIRITKPRCILNATRAEGTLIVDEIRNNVGFSIGMYKADGTLVNSNAVVRYDII
jgi:hypothetical protein